MGPTFSKRVERNCTAILRAVDRMLAESENTIIDSELVAVRELAKELLVAEPMAAVVEIGGAPR